MAEEDAVMQLPQLSVPFTPTILSLSQISLTLDNPGI
jgi:hypothetical protein